MVTAENEKVVLTLNHLIMTCQDGIVLRHHDLIKQAHARLSALKRAWHQAM